MTLHNQATLIENTLLVRYTTLNLSLKLAMDLIKILSSKAMFAQDHRTGEYPAGQAGFEQTHWSIVLMAGDQQSPQSLEALQKLCQTYWYPLYAFVRAQGYPPNDAEDLTQGFFEELIKKNLLQSAKCERGRFRSFLLTLLRHYLANTWNHDHREKRGGGTKAISFDQVEAEERYGFEPADKFTPESLYERRWILTLMGQVLRHLREEYSACGKESLFEQIKPAISDNKPARTYAMIGAECGMTEGAVTMAIQRLRKRYRALLLEEISCTVSKPEEVEDEIRHLIDILSR